jgi:hypothetical protein
MDEKSADQAGAVSLSHVQRGRQLQATARRILETLFGEPFDAEALIPIGSPPKPHRFDLASRSRGVVCECKAFTWTATGNVPSAKISTLREVAQYLSALPAETIKVVAMMRSQRSTPTESLAEYFCRLNAHVLGGIRVLESGDDGAGRWVRGEIT